MLKVFYSNQTESLVDILEDLTSATTPIDPAEVIVPNWNIASYLKFELARRRGIATGFNFRRFETFLEETLPDHGKLSLLSSHVLQQFILNQLLFDEPPTTETLEQYLNISPEDNRFRRAFQLSGQLTRFFEKYLRNRPEFVRHWPDGKIIEQELFRDSETWQRQLWLQIFSSESQIPKIELDDKTYIPPAWLGEAVDLEQLHLPEEIFIIGFSHLSRMHWQLIDQLSELTDLHFLTINPCREYWGDIRSMHLEDDEEQLSSKPIEGGQLNLLKSDNFWDQSPPHALRFWGLPGRDKIKLINELAEHGTIDHFVLPQGPETTLKAFQRDILEFTDPEETENREPDDSIAFIEAPSLRRELEIIAEKIWQLIESEDTLSFNDISVIINDADLARYQTHIDTVFGETSQIPYNLVDLTKSKQTDLVDGLLNFLKLPLSDRTRGELLRVICHPAFETQFEQADTEKLVEWVEALNILRGKDRTDLENTYFETDICSWSQGIQKGVVSSVLNPGRRTEEPIEISGETRFAVNINRQQRNDFFQFAGITRRISEEIEFCQDNRLSLSDWLTYVRGLLSEYFSESDNRSLSIKIRQRLLRLEENTVFDEPIPFRIAFEFIKEELEGIELQRGHYLADGVTISSLEPMRPIPFDTVFVVGMGEGKFPTTESESILDLRRAERKQGDVFEPQRDEYMFLETLLSARRKLYISHVASDPHSGEPIPAASTVQEFKHILEHQYWGQNGTEERTFEYSMSRYESTSKYHPEAHSESIAWELQKTIRKKSILKGQPPPTNLTEVKSLLPGNLLQKTPLQIDPPPAFHQTKETSNNRIFLRTSALSQFLKTPLQAWAKRVIGLDRDDKIDLFDREDEPFEVSSLVASTLLREVIESSLIENTSLEEAKETLQHTYHQRARYLEHRGTLPTAKLRKDNSQKHLRWLNDWLQKIACLDLDEFARLQFGSPRFQRSKTDIQKPIKFTSNDKTSPEEPSDLWQLDGFTQLLAPGRSIKFVARKRIKQTDFISGFIDLLLLRATGSTEAQSFTLSVVPVGSKDSRDAKFTVPSQTTAKKYLKQLVEVFITQKHDYLFPAELAFEYAQSDKSFDAHRYLDRKLNSYYSNLSSDYGPIRNPGEYELAPNWRKLFEKRWTLFFELQENT